jgi:OmpA-OmpF porin, OOP family
MTKGLIMKSPQLVRPFLLLAALLGLALPALAQISPVEDIVLDLKSDKPLPYNVDARGVIARSGTGLCWRTGYWTKELAANTPVVGGKFPAGCFCDKDVMAADPALKDKCEPPAAAPVAPPPAPIAAPAVKPAADKITLAADALFDFNKATLRAEGKAKLDDVVSKLGAIKLEVIIATGHADRFGSDGYNQKLSEKRANAVKDYLVGKGVDASHVYAEGKGKKQPKTKPDECKGKKTKKVVDCLQPDRRVDIEIIGTKAAK